MAGPRIDPDAHIAVQNSLQATTAHGIDEIHPRTAPGLNIPHSNCTVHVQAIDTTTNMVCDSNAFVRPIIAGHEHLNFTTVCFLIENKAQDKHVLFDCGARKDFWNGPPQTKKMIGGHVAGLRVEKGVDEILVDSGFDLKTLDAIVWSHWHWDHIGDGSKFPPSTDIVVGPGFTEHLLPGYPENPNAMVLASDFEGHRLHEISFDENLNIGPFKANDYFGDGSFYLLDVPGHAIGHMCGLARTTPTTFTLFGGDCCHFAGAFRPTAYAPLPAYIPASSLDSHYPSPCPCSIFTSIHPAVSSGSGAESNGSTKSSEFEARTTPFYKVTRAEGSAYTFAEIAEQSINSLQDFDASPDVFICIAHDRALMSVLPLLNDDPNAEIGDWKAKGYKERTKWGFLNELPKDGKPGRKPLVVGLQRGGKTIAMGGDGEFRDVER